MWLIGKPEYSPRLSFGDAQIYGICACKALQRQTLFSVFEKAAFLGLYTCCSGRGVSVNRLSVSFLCVLGISARDEFCSKWRGAFFRLLRQPQHIPTFYLLYRFSIRARLILGLVFVRLDADVVPLGSSWHLISLCLPCAEDYTRGVTRCLVCWGFFMPGKCCSFQAAHLSQRNCSSAVQPQQDIGQCCVQTSMIVTTFTTISWRWMLGHVWLAVAVAFLSETVDVQ